MLKTLTQLLGDERFTFYRYIGLTMIYAVLCGLSMVLLVLLLAQLLQGQYTQIHLFLLLMLSCIALCWALRRVVEQQGIQVGIAILSTGRLGLGQHVATLPVGWFKQKNSAQFNHIVSQGMMAIAQLPAHVFTPLLTGLMTPVVIVIALCFWSLKLGVITLIALPVLALVFYFSAKISAYTDATYQQNFAATSQRIVEFAQAQSVFRAFNGEGNSRRFLDQAFDTQRHSAFKLILLSSVAVVLNTWVIQLLFATLLVLALLALSLGSSEQLLLSDVVSTVVIIVLLCRFIEAVIEVASYSEVIRAASAQLAAIQVIFDEKALVESTVIQSLLDHSIQFNDVDFSYDDQNGLVLHGLNLSIASGKMTALIGASGSGKSTIAKLAARFYDVDRGQVLIGGVDVKQLPHAQLSAQISQIFQDNYLFAGSIADNLRLGRADASIEEMHAVLCQVGLSEMLANLTAGLESLVGEGGTRLSGGERQRLAIARALIKDAPILLVDEATAALDPHNQAIICDVLQRLRGQKTILVIAHQLSTIAAADHVAVLDQGKVVEQGSVAKLSQHNGYYQYFVQQSRQAQTWQFTHPVQVEV